MIKGAGSLILSCFLVSHKDITMPRDQHIDRILADESNSISGNALSAVVRWWREKIDSAGLRLRPCEGLVIIERIMMKKDEADHLILLVF